MSDILIKNMGIPKDYKYVDVRIFRDGTATTSTAENPFYKKMDVIEVPKHGRLIIEDAIDTVNNDAYLLTCECPICKTIIDRDYDEHFQYCPSCGTKIRMPPFSEEEIEKAVFENEMDEYEDL